MAENKVSVELTIEDRQALASISKLQRSIEKFASDTEKKMGKGEASFKNLFSGVTAGLAVFDLATGGAKKLLDAVVAIGKVPLEGALKAEELRATAQQFDLITRNAGLAGDALKSGLVAAADGLVSTDDLLAAASRSVVSLGQNASSLPQIFEVARKAASVFGGDLLDRFEDISNAIETGNVKQLKQIGLIVDVDKAYTQYAETLRVTKEELTTSEKQTALLNAVLQKSDSAFGGVDTNIRELNNTTLRFNAALQDLGEAGATAFDKIFGATVKGTASELVIALESLTRSVRRLGGETIPVDEQIKVLEQDLIRLKKSQEESAKAFGTTVANPYDEQVKSLEKQIALLEKRNAIEAGGSGDLPANLDPNAARNAFRGAQAQAVPLPPEDPEIIARNQKRIEAERKVQEEIALIQAQTDLAASERNVQLLANDQLFYNDQLTELQAFELAKLQLQFDAQAKKIEQEKKGQDQINALRINEANRNKAIEDLKTKQELEQQRIRQQNFKSSLSSIASLQSSSSKELFAIGKAAAIATATIDGIAAVQKALSAAPPPFNFVLAALVGAAQAVNLGKIASAQPPQFAQGGIVPGNSTSGDRVPALVNSGEMVLNKQQQAELFSIANGGGAGGNVVDAINALGDRIANMNIVVQANAREIARLVRDERESGFAV